MACEVEVRDWEDYESRIAAFRRERDSDNATRPAFAEMLFRGQGDARWGLRTTLDRMSSERLSLSSYYRIAYLARPQIEAFTQTRWQLPDPDDYDSELTRTESSDFSEPEGYDYLAYLRHHGFPSPFLDWTQSPYVAAFFAFRHIREDATHVAINVYRQQHGSEAPDARARIHKAGPYVSTDRRHFLQQSQYTFCTENVDGTVFYARHDAILGSGNLPADRYQKLVIPISERRTFLSRLYDMNINAYSLFGSHDSLVETLGTTELVIRRAIAQDGIHE
jgi:hypothetical protein